MAQPTFHSRTKTYWYRRVVPHHLRSLVRKTEQKQNLGTSDLAEARVRHAKVAAEVEARWANLIAGTRELTEREAHAIANTAHDAWLKWHIEEPSSQFLWQPTLFNRLWTEAVILPSELSYGADVQMSDIQILSMRRLCFEQADNALAHHGFIVDAYSRNKLAIAIGAAFQRSSLTLARLGRGESISDLLPRTVPPERTIASDPIFDSNLSALSQPTTRDDTLRVSLTGLLEGWWAEAKNAGRKPSTYENYGNAIKKFAAFLKHDNANLVNSKDIIAYKNFRLATPTKNTGKAPSAKTIKSTDLVALKTVFGWAVSNEMVATNPASGITIKVGKRQKLRDQGFTDQEARKILAAALTYKPGAEHACTAAAKRWVPWLCAFTGARVGEIGQLRKQDIYRGSGYHYLLITPEAGTVKTDEAREVVLHPQLEQLGFLDFVNQSSNGPLFLMPGLDGDTLRPLKNLKNRLAEFSRAIVTDRHVAPNHGWRHRFKTIGMELEIQTRVLDAIQGHTGRSVSDKYGEVTLRTKAIAIKQLPWIDL